MYMFVSWSFLSSAQKAEESRVGWVESLISKDDDDSKALADKLTCKYCLPEYDAYLQALEGNSDEPPEMDELNADLLSIRFVIPAMEKVVTYQLAKRMPGTNKLPVSLACRSFLLNTFKGEWSGDLTAPAQNRLVLVGLRGTKDFLAQLSMACAALGEPLPVDFWKNQPVVELPEDGELRKLIDACAFNQKRKSDQEKYQDLITGWLGSSASAERDIAIALAVGFRLGLKGS